jgi:hypothetical protein
MNNLTKLGWVVAIISSIIVLLVIGAIANHINWVGDHYCFKSMVECYGLENK